jgi:hypothetical protein
MTESTRLGDEETPIIPGTGFRVHDETRPQPRMVRPGTPSAPAQPGDPSERRSNGRNEVLLDPVGKEHPVAVPEPDDILERETRFVVDQQYGQHGGGILRQETPEFAFTSGFDPTGEYLSTSFSIFSQMMLRNLVTYRHVAGDAGNEIVPDLAEDLPEVSEDGLTYSFTIKDGVMFGPPVSREIVCDDILYAFERIGTERIVAQYGFYYDNTIEGLADFKAGNADEISGVQCTGDKEIEFTLTEETGDFLFRLAMPAAAPVPREVGECFEKAGEYGRFVIASGPYMIEGSDDLDISSCNAMAACCPSRSTFSTTTRP